VFVGLSEWWRERRASGSRQMGEQGAGLIVFEAVAVAALILILSLLVWGEVRWAVVGAAAAGFAIFAWQAHRNSRFERAFERSPEDEERSENGVHERSGMR
jgi:Flp pilus assembly protein TadB